MLFNTLAFFIFFFIVYSLYLILPHRWQNRMLLVASYIFYGSWDAVFLTLIFISTILDYVCGLEIDRSGSPARRKFFLGLSMCGNLGILGVFKYFDFFAENLVQLAAFLGVHLHLGSLQVVLPVGISFYTFQTMSYTIDIYRGQLKPTRKLFDFALYVAFFPQLVAGPIERAVHLLPQILKPRTVTLEGFTTGSYLIFWGLFQKVFVADNLARIADPVFAGTGPYAGGEVLVAVYAFTIQIFCDFAGYSNIARGLGKCMGFDIMVNFNLPYFATNPRELWQRWHISFSSWLRDYLFKSLGGYTRGKARALRNIFITFFLGGLWHGANWTFVVWGIYHAVLLILYVVLRPYLQRVGEPRSACGKNVWFWARVVGFFHLFCLGALIFRAQSLGQAAAMLSRLGIGMTWSASTVALWQDFVFFCWPLWFIQLVQFRRNNLMAVLEWPVTLRVLTYTAMFYLLLVFGVQGGEQFYYFQF